MYIIWTCYFINVPHLIFIYFACIQSAEQQNLQTGLCVSSVEQNRLVAMDRNIPPSEFEKLGFRTLLTKREHNLMHLRVNVMNEEDAEKWRIAYCVENKVTLNVFRTHRRKVFFRKTYICLHGDKRHQGKKKDFTG